MHENACTPNRKGLSSNQNSLISEKRVDFLVKLLRTLGVSGSTVVLPI